jgi:hypothetical protein
MRTVKNVPGFMVNGGDAMGVSCATVMPAMKSQIIETVNVVLGRIVTARSIASHK